ncbi:hypothetical protein CC1G_12389 [Coprinopsis cinerea okayama7|uniref:MYND-type domain-containing protein n=1 Tax=Coprinopsis cinerea (strain Okayama-7 / 130 / ATCC MYA-4618 / FGSC 9003) TaxID=240176 RepID=A8NLT1_COPC7|nr:hypothetical protein CC1G_12389 [Coprinopsis cinerea okayama7\|eukprot:XP_001834769.2 hypothetical protein CC1G_12389 [Coprinopsis cinerea okayama7\
MSTHNVNFDYAKCVTSHAPLMKDSVMVLREWGISRVEQWRDELFNLMEASWAKVGDDVPSTSAKPPNESPYRRWYRRVATGTTAVRQKVGDGRIPNGRLIAWNPKRPWIPKNLYFRSVDTCRLLPMFCADFRLEVYGLQSHWDWLEKKREDGSGIEYWATFAFMSTMHHILFLRNFRDFGGGDIPVLLVDWSTEEMDAACDFWVGLSRGKWSKEEITERFQAIDQGPSQNPHRRTPCFYQVDQNFRALLGDPEVGYVPPFVILYPLNSHAIPRAVFTHPDNVPPPSLTHDFPKGCNSPGCHRPKDCCVFDLEKSVSLVAESWLVRKHWSDPTVRCNYWPCNNEEPRLKPGEKVKDSMFLKCSKCKDVVYCSKTCQQADWNHHKVICQTPP